jgi:hypothetical protein
MPSRMVATRDATCSVCQEKIARGDIIIHQKKNGKHTIKHLDCTTWRPKQLDHLVVWSANIK